MAFKARRSLVCAAGVSLLAATALSACGSSDDNAPSGASASASSSTVISSAECDQNKAAGQVTFLTSYQYAATVGILDVLAASNLGYFKDVCLDVKMVPGVTNTQLLSAGKAQLAGVGSPGDILEAREQGANIVGVTTYGNTAADVLITNADSGINTLKDFEGKTVGYKGYLAPSLREMLVNGGVDLSKVKLVSVGYDPTILPQGQVDAIGAYASNEPVQLQSKGYKIKVWAPGDYGVQASFNTQAANATFAKEHPTAVSDFLRASFKAYSWIQASDANLEQALTWAKEKTPSGFDHDLAKQRWQIETKMVTDSQPKGTPLGTQTAAQWQSVADELVKYELVKKTPDVTAAFTNEYVEQLYTGTTLTWGTK